MFTVRRDRAGDRIYWMGDRESSRFPRVHRDRCNHLSKHRSTNHLFTRPFSEWGPHRWILLSRASIRRDRESFHHLSRVGERRLKSCALAHHHRDPRGRVRGDRHHDLCRARAKSNRTIRPNRVLATGDLVRRSSRPVREHLRLLPRVARSSHPEGISR